MGCEPALVRGVARKAAAQMVVAAALADPRERKRDAVFELRFAGQPTAPPDHVKRAGHGEFGRKAEPAVTAVELAVETARTRFEMSEPEPLTRDTGGVLHDGAGQDLGILLDLVG